MQKFPLSGKVVGCPGSCQVKALGDTIDTTHYSFQVVQTSGHSRDHVIFFLRGEYGYFIGDDLFLKMQIVPEK